MRSPDTVDAVNCASCGTGLDLLGGGRVASAFCGSCGSELDPNENFRVVRDLQLQLQHRPRTPFSIGMSGMIRGVKWTIIGTIGMGEYEGVSAWHWAEHQLYSPTHGYAWLTFETGVATFSRRVRPRRSFPLYGKGEIEQMENPPTARREGMLFQYYESGTAIIESLEGEFSWKPSLGDKRYGQFYAPSHDLAQIFITGQPSGEPRGFEVSKPELDSGEVTGEKELDEISYLNQREIELEFGLRRGTLRHNVPHPLRPWPKSPTLNFASLVALIFVAITLFAMAAANDDKPIVLQGTTQISALPLELPFEVTAAGRGVEIYVQADSQNAWGWIETGIYDPEDIPVFEVGREVGVYRGVEGGESWSEGTNNTRIRFRAETAGDYTLELDIPETGVWTGSNMGIEQISTVRYSVRENLGAVKWLGMTALLFLFIAALSALRRMWSTITNWSGTDW